MSTEEFAISILNGSFKYTGKPVASGLVADILESLQVEVVSSTQEPDVEKTDLFPLEVGMITSTIMFLPITANTSLFEPKSSVAP